MAPTPVFTFTSAQQDNLSALARRWEVEEFFVFGSALGDAMRPDSDVDLLVEFQPGVRRTLFDLMTMEEELQGIVGRPVDLLTRRSVAQSANRIRSRAILASARPLLRVAR